MKVGDIYRTKSYKDFKYSNFMNDQFIKITAIEGSTVKYSYFEDPEPVSCQTYINIFTEDTIEVSSLLKELF